MTFKKTMWLNHKTKSLIKVQNTPSPSVKCKMVPPFNIVLIGTSKNVGPPEAKF